MYQRRRLHSELLEMKSVLQRQAYQPDCLQTTQTFYSECSVSENVSCLGEVGGAVVGRWTRD